MQIIESIDENGIVNQAIFKTNDKYGFDSLIFSDNVLTLIKNYINIIRPRLNPCCDHVLICQNGKQISKLSNIFGRIVFLATGKCIKPTRYRQIIETESTENLLLRSRHFSVKIESLRRMLQKLITKKLNWKILL